MLHPGLALSEWNTENILYMYKFVTLQSFMMSNTLYVVLHIPLLDKSIQFHLFRILNIPLSHPNLKKSFRYSIQKEYLAIRSDKQYISFPLNMDIMTCQVSNGQFCHFNSPIYAADTSNSCSYILFYQDKNKINKFCILSVTNQMNDEAININDCFWAISILQNNKKALHNLFTIWLLNITLLSI